MNAALHTSAVIALLLVCSACRKPPAHAQPMESPTGVQSTVTPPANRMAAFDRASEQYLSDAKAIKDDCAALLTAKFLAAVTKDHHPVVCGKMTLDFATTRQRIDAAHRVNQQAPWSGDDVFMGGVFRIEQGGSMSVMFLPQEDVVMFTSEP